ncbi:MAG: carboxy terminal-processing peptidase [Pseudomonadota bacterium]
MEPDIQLPATIDMNEVGESSLEAALPWDRIAPANFQHYVSPKPIPTAMALDRSEADRGRTDPDFQWLVGDIAAYTKLRAQKVLSLNLVTRKAERESIDADQLRRENERRKAQGKPVFTSLTELEASTGATTGDDADDAPAPAADGSAKPGKDGKPVPADAPNTAATPAKEKQPDILLDSTTQIMADIVTGIEPAAAPRPLAAGTAKAAPAKASKAN